MKIKFKKNIIVITSILIVVTIIIACINLPNNAIFESNNNLDANNSIELIFLEPDEELIDYIDNRLPNGEVVTIDLNDTKNEIYKSVINSLWHKSNYREFEIIENSINDNTPENYTKEYIEQNNSSKFILINNYFVDRSKRPWDRDRYLNFYDKNTGNLYGSIKSLRFALYYPYDENSLIIGLFKYPDSMTIDNFLPSEITDYYYFLLTY